jgi:deferrochelatase/peroxidase EfeB
MGGCPFNFTRRGFLSMAGLAAAAGAGFGAREAVKAVADLGSGSTGSREPFRGVHQGGILTPAQSHTYFAAFDVVTEKREDLIALLQRWTDAAARLAEGKTVGDVEPADAKAPHDGGDSLGLSLSRLTLTFGFGSTLFSNYGKDRFGLAKQRPEALVDLPTFPGDQLAKERTGGDLSVQACADDPQVAFHAVRQLIRLADGVAQIRWTQSGFCSTPPDGGTPRNLMGFKDGTGNPSIKDASLMDKFVWAGSEAPGWMQGGSYVVARRARIALEHWDKMAVAFQEQTFGRKKLSGAPLGREKEFDKADLTAVDSDGNFIIPEGSHLRLATAASNDGAQILRRSYSYNDGVNMTAERWPPWRQGMEYDAGLLFICYQRDPRTGFIRIFDKLSKLDMMNQFVTHVGGGLFACPGGVDGNDYIGQRMFEAI